MVPEQRVKLCTYKACRMVPEQRMKVCTYQVRRMVPQQCLKTCTYQVCRTVSERCVRYVRYTVFTQVRCTEMISSLRTIERRVACTVARHITPSDPRVCSVEVRIPVFHCCEVESPCKKCGVN